MKLCSISGCTKPVLAKNLCSAHYARNSKGQALDTPIMDYGEHSKTHGGYKTKLYGCWRGMKSRCLNPNSPLFKNYGGRGITIYNDWNSFEPFRNWALENGYTEGLTIERINVNSGYFPDNCTWIPLFKQLENTRRSVLITAFGETKLLRDWGLDLRASVVISTISRRLKRGWDPEQAITHPALYNGK